jgi:hypothetical protein
MDKNYKTGIDIAAMLGQNLLHCPSLPLCTFIRTKEMKQKKPCNRPMAESIVCSFDFKKQDAQILAKLVTSQRLNFVLWLGYFCSFT